MTEWFCDVPSGSRTLVVCTAGRPVHLGWFGGWGQHLHSPEGVGSYSPFSTFSPNFKLCSPKWWRGGGVHVAPTVSLHCCLFDACGYLALLHWFTVRHFLFDLLDLTQLLLQVPQFLLSVLRLWEKQERFVSVKVERHPPITWHCHVTLFMSTCHGVWGRGGPGSWGSRVAGGSYTTTTRRHVHDSIRPSRLTDALGLKCTWPGNASDPIKKK